MHHFPTALIQVLTVFSLPLLFLVPAWVISWRVK